MNSQSRQVERLVAFGRRLAQKRFQFRQRSHIGEAPLPRDVVGILVRGAHSAKVADSAKVSTRESGTAYPRARDYGSPCASFGQCAGSNPEVAPFGRKAGLNAAGRGALDHQPDAPGHPGYSR